MRVTSEAMRIRLRLRRSAHTPAGSASTANGRNWAADTMATSPTPPPTASTANGRTTTGHPVAEDREHLAGEEQAVLRLVAQHRGQPRAQPAPARRLLGGGALSGRVVGGHGAGQAWQPTAPARQRVGRLMGRPAAELACPPMAGWGRYGGGLDAGPNAATQATLDPIERASVDELRALQLDRLQWSLRHAYENVAALPQAFDDGRRAPRGLPVAGRPRDVPVHHQAGPARQLPVRHVRRAARAGVAGARLVRYDGPPDRRRLHRRGHHAPGRR